MAPAYASRYAGEHGLEAPVRDVKACLITKARRCLSEPLPSRVRSRVVRGSAIDCHKTFRSLSGRVDCVITSPPYLSAQTYAKDNWLRHWLLGYDYRELRSEYIQTQDVSRYSDSLAQVFQSIERLLRPGGRLVCIAGDVPVRRERRDRTIETRVVRTGSILADVCRNLVPGLKVTTEEVQLVPSRYRYFHSLSETTGHSKHAIVERLFVAEKRVPDC
jgi:hypothetical protein